MARPKGSTNQKTGKTYFFGDDLASKTSSKHQVAVHHDTSNHWSAIHYLDGEQGNKERITYREAIILSGLSQEEFDRIYGRTETARFSVDCQKNLEEFRAKRAAEEAQK